MTQRSIAGTKERRVIERLTDASGGLASLDDRKRGEDVGSEDGRIQCQCCAESESIVSSASTRKIPRAASIASAVDVVWSANYSPRFPVAVCEVASAWLWQPRRLRAFLVSGECDCGCPTIYLTVDLALPVAEISNDVASEAEIDQTNDSVLLFARAGRLSSLEYVWIDEAPQQFPAVHRLRRVRPRV